MDYSLTQEIYKETEPFDMLSEHVVVVFKRGWTYKELNALIDRLQELVFEGN